MSFVLFSTVMVVLTLICFLWHQARRCQGPSLCRPLSPLKDADRAPMVGVQVRNLDAYYIFVALDAMGQT